MLYFHTHLNRQSVTPIVAGAATRARRATRGLLARLLTRLRKARRANGREATWLYSATAPTAPTVPMVLTPNKERDTSFYQKFVFHNRLGRWCGRNPQFFFETSLWCQLLFRLNLGLVLHFFAHTPLVFERDFTNHVFGPARMFVVAKPMEPPPRAAGIDFKLWNGKLAPKKEYIVFDFCRLVARTGEHNKCFVIHRARLVHSVKLPESIEANGKRFV